MSEGEGPVSAHLGCEHGEDARSAPDVQDHFALEEMGVLHDAVLVVQSAHSVLRKKKR